MRKCSVVPYEGNKPYIFISYCHKDEAIVFPIVEFLEKERYRVWYDRGIDPGSEWPEVIADHLVGSAVVLVFISENSMASHNCRREFNLTVMENKPSLAIILDDVQFTPVMKMQMSSVQAIQYRKNDAEDNFFDNLKKLPIIEVCREPESEDECTVYIPRTHEENRPPFLLRKSTGEKVALSHDEFKIGRKKELCDYVIEDNMAISRVHAIFEMQNGKFYMKDNYSLNKVYVNDEPIREGDRVELTNADIIDIGGELFEFRVSEAE